MKKLLALVFAAAGIAAAAPEASAGGRCGVGINFGHGHGIKLNFSPCHVYKLYTKEICRRYFCKTHYTHCGRPYHVRYVTITYRDFYSNGTSRTYTRTLRA